MRFFRFIVNSILNGLPLAGDTKDLITGKRDANGLPVDQGSIYQRIAGLMITGCTVYMLAWLLNHFKISAELVSNLFGLLK